MRDEPISYWDYLHLPQLLDLQHGIDRDESELAQDEIHFIMVHQVFELWFKLIIHELRLASGELASPQVPEEKIPFVVHHLSRVNTILNHAITQFDVMETLDPQDFISFRDKLVPASGLQSYQYRILEILLGIESTTPEYGDTVLKSLQKMMAQTASGEEIWQKVTAARSEVTLRSALHEWLLRTPIDPVGGEDRAATADRFLEAYLSGYERSLHATLTAIMGNSEPDKLQSRLEEGVGQVGAFLRAEDQPEANRPRTRMVRAGILFIESYRDLPLLAWPRLLLETVVVLEERLLLWRTRHVRMVERIIGQRIGTGGTSGAGFLEQRNKGRIFPELWQVRTILLSRKFLPDLKRPEFYAFEDSRLS